MVARRHRRRPSASSRARRTRCAGSTSVGRSRSPRSWSVERPGSPAGPRRRRPGRCPRPRPARSPRRACRSVSSRPRGPLRPQIRWPARTASVACSGVGGDDQEATAGLAVATPVPWASSTCASRSRPKAKPTPRSSRSLPSTRARPSYRPPPQTSTGPSGVGGDQLEDHLRVEPDPPAEAEVELDAVEVDAVVAERLDKARSAATESGASASKSRPRRSRTAAGGPFRSARLVDLAADPVQGPEQAVAEVPLAPQPVDDLVARAAAGDDRDERPEEPVDAAVVGPSTGAGDLAASRRPGASRELFQARLQRLDVPPLGGGLAEHLDQGRRQRRGQARALEHLEDQADVPEPDRRVRDARPRPGPSRRARSPRRRRCGPESPSRSTPTCWNSRSRPGRGVS